MSAQGKKPGEQSLRGPVIIIAVTLGVGCALIVATRPALKPAVPPGVAETRQPDSQTAPRQTLEEPVCPGTTSRSSATRMSSTKNKMLNPPRVDNGPNSIIRPTSRTGPNNAAIAVTDKDTGESTILNLGQRTADGYRFMSMDAQSGTARFEKSGRSFSTPFASPTASQNFVKKPVPTTTAPLISGGYLVSPGPMTPAEVKPVEPFKPVTLQAKSGATVNLSPIASNPDLVKLDAGGRSYVIPRNITEGMINDPQMTPDEQIERIVTYPNLAEVHPGEDPSAVAVAAEESGLPPPPPNVPTIPAPPSGPPPGM
jgi:hypothetical protein